MKHFACLCIPALAALLTACGGPGSYAEREDFQGDTRYKRDFAVAAGPLCEAGRRVLLGEGYVVEARDGLNLVATKEFRLEEKGHARMRLYLTCLERRNGATLFLTATEEHFDVKTLRQTTAVGVPVVGPVSFSSKTEGDSQVKTRGETVADRRFYERFYGAVGRELGGVPGQE